MSATNQLHRRVIGVITAMHNVSTSLQSCLGELQYIIQETTRECLKVICYDPANKVETLS